jgi:carbohydrate kinase (thermoresistant glucokinase family)
VNPPVLVVMGVSGSGKTTVGRELAARLGWAFEDGDDLHPAANIAKMKRGEPLDDADRGPYLANVAAWIDGRAAAGEPGVVTCSALKRAYRAVLTAARPFVRIVYLDGSHALVGERIARRTGHFMPPSLLESQFETLEPPGVDENPLVISVDQSVEAQVGEVIEALGLDRQMPAYHS